MREYPPADRHLPLQECFPDVWVARSANAMSIPLGLTITFSRNMIAVCTPDGWVLLNPVRLSEDAEANDPQARRIGHTAASDPVHNHPRQKRADRKGNPRPEGDEVGAHPRAEDAAARQC